MGMGVYTIRVCIPGYLGSGMGTRIYTIRVWSLVVQSPPWLDSSLCTSATILDLFAMRSLLCTLCYALHAYYLLYTIQCILCIVCSALNSFCTYATILDLFAMHAALCVQYAFSTSTLNILCTTTCCNISHYIPCSAL